MVIVGKTDVVIYACFVRRNRENRASSRYKKLNLYLINVANFYIYIIVIPDADIRFGSILFDTGIPAAKIFFVIGHVHSY